MKWRDDELAIVTGGGTGLGRAIARGLARSGAHVLITGRREAPLADTAAFDPERIGVISADLAEPEERARIAAAIPEGRSVRALIHNAGALEPMGPLREADADAWRRAMAINVEAPVFLTQALLPHMVRGSRVLHISSGAAHKPMAGWGAYCTSKAALYMVYQVYREELWPEGILFGSVRPGVVDTPMQELIRAQSASRFPAVERFIKLKENGQLYDPESAADFALWALLETGDRQFTEVEWNIADEEHQQRWQSTRQL